MTKSEAGRLGGQATHKKYGSEHMSKIGALGAEAFHRKYRLQPAGIADFAIIDRISGKVVAHTSGNFR